MDAVVGIDTDQIGIEGSMMDLGQREPVGDHRLSKFFVTVGDDVCGIQQPALGPSRNGAATIISGEYSFAERRLVKALADQAERVAPFGR